MPCAKVQKYERGAQLHFGLWVLAEQTSALAAWQMESHGCQPRKPGLGFKATVNLYEKDLGHGISEKKKCAVMIFRKDLPSQ